MTRRLLLLALAAIALLGNAASASAETCPTAFSPQCFTVNVPLDYSGALPGTIPLPVVRFQATTQPARGTLVVLVGGPGQAAVPFSEDFRSIFKGLISAYDVVVFDERGTGDSALRCASFDDRNGDGDPATCAAQIGPARSLYTTRDAVADLEQVRQRLGVPRISIFGVSYGTRIARAYAATHPLNTDRLVLDSAVPLNGPDSLLRSTVAALHRVLDTVCARKACRGITSSPYSDLVKLVGGLNHRHLKGYAVDSRGHRHKASIGSGAVFELLGASDIDPVVRALAPSALRAARAGDAAPILRVLVGGGGSGSDPPEADSDALFAATTCEEDVFPWLRTAPAAAHEASARATLAAIAPQLAPFKPATIYNESVLPLCAPWPTAPAPPPIATGPLSGIPTLILTGQEDLRTPVEDQSVLASGIAGAQIVQVANTGHSVLGTAPDNCPINDVVKFFGNLAVSNCLSSKPIVPVAPLPPRSLSRTSRAAGVGGTRGRVVGAVALTIQDGIEQALSGLSAGVSRTPSLRGGYYRFNIDSGSIELHNAAFVTGVKVSGRLPDPKHGIVGRFTISAGSLSGKLSLAHHRLTGTLGHRHVRSRASARIASAGGEDRLDALAAAFERVRRQPWLALP